MGDSNVSLTDTLRHHPRDTDESSDSVDMTVNGDFRLVHLTERVEGFGVRRRGQTHLLLLLF